MSVEFIGYIGTRKFSEIHPAEGRSRSGLCRDRRQGARAGRLRSCPDRVSFDGPGKHPGRGPCGLGDRAADLHDRAPARISRPRRLPRASFATLDQLTGGRIAVHIITGGNDAEQRQDGDFLGHDERYARTDEYLGVLRRILDQRTAV